MVRRILVPAHYKIKLRQLDYIQNHIVIGICTFRRAHIVDTIEAVGKINVPADVTVSILVADNDGSASAKFAVENAKSEFPVTYIHAPERNISIARNAILDKVRRDAMSYLVFIDDDEVVTPDWLIALWERHKQSGEGVVVGPVQADYLDTAPDWLRSQSLHDTYPDVDEFGNGHTGYTCNVLLDLQNSKLSGLRFDLQRGRSGGEDSAFFSAYQTRGGRIAFAKNALVCETVPENRASFRWLATRRFRMGQTHGQLISEGQGLLKRITKASVAGAKTSFCAISALLTVVSPARRNKALIRGAMHLGVLSGCLGQNAITLYGADDAATGTKKV